MGGDCPPPAPRSLLKDDQVNIYAGVNSEVSDFLNDARGAVDVDHSLVDAHLEAVPGLGTLTAGALTGRDSQNLGGNAHGALGLVTLVLGAGDDLTAGALERLGLSAPQSHSKARRVSISEGPEGG